jgi:predicted enzyme involved in methoxymalonyl-ACP biosynthesis
MSCRVIGRNIEFQFLDGVFQRLLSTGVKKISAKYLTTVKNKQVKFFYDSVQFYLTHENQMSREYELDLNEYKFGKINYIRMIKE